MSDTSHLADEEFMGELLEELADKLRHGSSPSISTFDGRWPGHASRVRRLLPAVRRMLQLAEFDGDSDGLNGVMLRQQHLGDFRVIRELGRGGMGVVYEAEQLSIRRRVALKILPVTASSDPKAIARFEIEARAAGALNHPNIVPVLSVGSEADVHYYAMPLINGISLAQLISELRMRANQVEAGQASAISVESILFSTQHSTLSGGSHQKNTSSNASEKGRQQRVRPQEAKGYELSRDCISRIVKIGLQVAEALSFAHRQGILHRDVKPGNLLIDRDGKAWVTDFGLARIENDRQVTETGEILGTLRYTSPEQALSNEMPVDQRADVYSLGATLYEVLTSRPLFDSEKRGELLHKLHVETPPGLRKFNRRIHVDLETIILKSISKDPAERYSSCREMALDLKRFLENRPIQARRASVYQRLVKLGRRHPVWIGASALVLTVVLLAVSITNFLLASAYDRVAREKAIANEDFELAVAAVDRLSRSVQSEPGLDLESRRRLLSHALEYYNSFLSRRRGNSELREKLADSYWAIGQIHRELGCWEDSRVAHQEALKQREALVTKKSRNVVQRSKLAESLARVSECGRYGTGEARLEQAERNARDGALLAEELFHEQKSKDSWKLLTDCLFELGSVQNVRGDVESARLTTERAFNLQQGLINQFGATSEQLWELAVAHRNLARVYRASNESQKAIQLLEHAIQLHEQFDAEPFDQNVVLFRSYSELGELHSSNGQLGKSENYFQTAIKMAGEQKEKYPDLVRPRGCLVSSYRGIAKVHALRGKLHKASKWFNKSIREIEALIDLGDDYQGRWSALAQCNVDLAECFAREGDHNDAILAFDSADKIWIRLTRQHSDDMTYKVCRITTILSKCRVLLAVGQEENVKTLATNGLELIEAARQLRTSNTRQVRQLNAIETQLLSIVSEVGGTEGRDELATPRADSEMEPIAESVLYEKLQADA